jgi:hypothetical protein
MEDSPLIVKYHGAGFIPSRSVVMFISRSSQLRKSYSYVGGELRWIFSRGERILIHLSLGIIGFVVVLTLGTFLWRGCR